MNCSYKLYDKWQLLVASVYVFSFFTILVY